MNNNPNIKEIISSFLENNILLSDDLLLKGKFSKVQELKEKINQSKEDISFLILNSDILDRFKDNNFKANWLDMERYRVLFEKGTNSELYSNFLNITEEFKEEKEEISIPNIELKEIYPVNIIQSFSDISQKRTVQDFVSYFTKRYHSLKSILEKRQELQGLTSINRIKNKKDKGSVSLIGMISSKSITKNNNIILEIEDPSGSMKLIISKNKPELFNLANTLVEDEVIGVVGANGDNVVFANNILLPDIPISKELKKCKEEVYAIFLSDIHIGSKQFLKEEFEKFLKWISGEVGSETQREISKKVKYIFIVGDIVDGVGIYPNQISELEIKDIYQQYSTFTELIKKIPQDKKIIICPGNHDSLRLAEPQPAFDKKYIGELVNIPNVTLLSNPSFVNIHKSDGFPGFDILLYHGYSFDYFISSVNHIRENGGYDRADLVMKFLLQRRHLSPTHSATLYIPDNQKDPLVIEKIPDFFITGHIHKSSVSMYRNITLISGSCWQSKTSFQEKVGHNPEPSRVPIANLSTREVKILRF